MLDKPANVAVVNVTLFLIKVLSMHPFNLYIGESDVLKYVYI